MRCNQEASEEKEKYFIVTLDTQTSTGTVLYSTVLHCTLSYATFCYLSISHALPSLSRILSGHEGITTVAVKMLKENASEVEKKDLLSELEHCT
uniref:Uncharacterized protein n=1 Tax=Glossina brevipalpis TaxID=37001 RepID=A0A1A9WPU3_9MUSC